MQDENYVSACILSQSTNGAYYAGVGIAGTSNDNNGDKVNRTNNDFKGENANEFKSSWNVHDNNQNKNVVATFVITNGQHVWSVAIDEQRNTYGPAYELNEEMQTKTSMRQGKRAK